MIKVYLSARVSPDAHAWNERVGGVLKEPFAVFMPHKNSPGNLEHEHFPRWVYDKCLAEMKKSDLGLLLPPYGMDCAWEVGWYANSGKPLVVFVGNDLGWLRDWMIKGGIDYVITTDRETWKKLNDDPILRFKSLILIQDISGLGQELIKINRRHKHAKGPE